MTIVKLDEEQLQKIIDHSQHVIHEFQEDQMDQIVGVLVGDKFETPNLRGVLLELARAVKNINEGDGFASNGAVFQFGERLDSAVASLGSHFSEPHEGSLSSEVNDLTDAIERSFISPNETDSNGETANITDAVFALGRMIFDSATKITSGLDNIAEAIRGKH